MGGPLFFANVDKFVDQLYSDVFRPSDVKQPTTVSVVVSDELNVEMKELHSSKVIDGVEYRDVQNTALNEVHEISYQNDMTEEDVVVQRLDVGSIRVVVLDCSKVTFVDSMAAAALQKVSTAYQNVGIQLVVSGCGVNMSAMMVAACLLDNIKMYPTVHDAVMAVG